MTLENILLIITGTLTALLAGLLYCFAVAINPGLRRLKDAEYVRAMQAINIAILNPLFLPSFVGPFFLLPLVTFLHRNADSTRFGLLLAATVIHLVGAIFVTIAGNIPLNDKLAAFNQASASDKSIAEARAMYEKPWGRLNAIRTLASTVATALIFAAAH